MNRFTLKIGVGRTLRSVSLALLATGVFTGYASAQLITNSKHDLSSTSTGGNSFSGTGEICVFCHTPHGSDATAAVPLWNRSLTGLATYTTYDQLGTSTLNGTILPVGSASIACLSCHDGSTALNTVSNTPGTGSTAMAGTWTGTLTTGKISGAFTNLSGDLKNDHPIGVQYGGGPNGAIPAAGTPYSNFKDLDFNTAQSATINTKPVWWVDVAGGTASARDKTDMLLYTRLNGATNEPFVECATCHDPHKGGAGQFLRTANTGSVMCLACHKK
jgi:predicted CXXCH cytochrome family protein